MNNKVIYFHERTAIDGTESDMDMLIGYSPISVFQSDIVM